MSFVFQGYVEDAEKAIPLDSNEVARRQTFLDRIKKSAVSGSNDVELNSYISRFQEDNLKYRSLEGHDLSSQTIQFRAFMDSYMEKMNLQLIVTEPETALQESHVFEDFMLYKREHKGNIGDITKLLEAHTRPLDEDSRKSLLLTLKEDLDTLSYRSKFLYDEICFIYGLTGISCFIKSLNFGKNKEEKREWLRICLEDFQHVFKKNVYFPMKPRNGDFYRIMNVVVDDAVVLNSRDRVPYLVVFEAIQGSDNELDLAFEPHEDKEIVYKNIQDGEESKEGKDDGVLQDTVEKETSLDNDWVCLEPSPEDPPSYLDEIFGVAWEDKKKQYRSKSKFGKYKNWDLISVIVKGGDDLRQEQLATSIINKFHDIFRKAKLSTWLYPYEILAVSSDGGFIETIHDTVSIHVLKSLKNRISLREYFIEAYPEEDKLGLAQLNFAASLAGYSLICYILQIKDRHNGNILIDRHGHIIHIDYGFILTSSPGSWGFEKAPFKLTMEYIEVMGGARETNKVYNHFIQSFQEGFLEIRKHCEDIISTVEMMMPGSDMACFSKKENTIQELRSRFQLGLSDEAAEEFVVQLINQSKDHWRTISYDKFQSFSNYIY